MAQLDIAGVRCDTSSRDQVVRQTSGYSQVIAFAPALVLWRTELCSQSHQSNSTLLINVESFFEKPKSTINKYQDLCVALHFQHFLCARNLAFFDQAGVSWCLLFPHFPFTLTLSNGTDESLAIKGCGTLLGYLPTSCRKTEVNSEIVRKPRKTHRQENVQYVEGYIFSGKVWLFIPFFRFGC